jgi:hypothetical protein
VAIDGEQLAGRLATLIADEPRRRAMGEAGRAKVRERFRASAIVRQYEALWDELAAGPATLADWRSAAVTPPSGVASPTADAAALSPNALFRAYPTRMLSPADLVATVPGAAIDPPYRDVAPLLDGPVLAAICARCATPTPIGELVTLAADAARGWFAVMWLLKYGVLRLLCGGLSRPPQAAP